MITLALSSAIWAQAPAAKTVAPDAVVATIDGQPLTAAEVMAIVQANNPEARSLLKDPKAYVERLALIRKLAAMGEKAHLDQVSPTKEMLELQRRQTLANAQLNAAIDAIPVTAEEHKKFYEDNKDRYTQAKVKVLFVSFKANPVPQADPKAKKILTESEARAKVDKLLADIRGGADFVKLVKENSDDAESVAREGDRGDLIRRSDKLPDNIKAAIFSLKPKQVSDPVRVSTGFYLFRLEELTAQPFEQVRDDIWIEIRQGHFNKWLENTQKDIQVKIENPEFFINAAAGK